MKKTWMEPAIEELGIETTANGVAPSDAFDDTWVEIDGKWYRPGDGKTSE